MRVAHLGVRWECADDATMSTQILSPRLDFAAWLVHVLFIVNMGVSSTGGLGREFVLESRPLRMTAAIFFFFFFSSTVHRLRGFGRRPCEWTGLFHNQELMPRSDDEHVLETADLLYP